MISGWWHKVANRWWVCLTCTHTTFDYQCWNKHMTVSELWLCCRKRETDTSISSAAMPQHKRLNQDKWEKCSLAAWIGKSNHFRRRIVAESRSKIMLTRRHFFLFVHFSFDGMKWEWWTCQSEKLLHLQYLSEISPLLSSILFRNYPYFVFQSTTIHQIPFFSLYNSSPKHPDPCAITRKKRICLVTKVAIWWYQAGLAVDWHGSGDCELLLRSQQQPSN